MPTGPHLCLYQILTKYFKPHTQEFGLEIHSGEVTEKQPQQRLCLLHVTHILVITNASIKYYQRVSKLWSAQNFGFKGDNYIMKWELSLLHVTHLLVLFISTKYYHIISNSMGVMACTRFCFRGDNYIKWELSLLQGTRLLLLFISTKHYQNMSKGNSYGAHKILASGEITT